MESIYGRQLVAWDWRVGGRADVWLTYERVAGDFIGTHGLTSVFSESRGPVVHGTTIKMRHERTIDIEEIDDIHGGMRVPHLHYRGETYLLGAKQWQEFSGAIIKEFRKKLDEAKAVNFGQFMELADTMSAIPEWVDK